MMLEDAPYVLHYFFINPQMWTAAQALCRIHYGTLCQALHVVINIISIIYMMMHMQAWGGSPDNKQKAQDILSSLAKANSEAQLGKYTGPHPAAGGGRILQALRTGGSGKS